eukprot:2867671-Prymnesium_polylepis.1
MCAAPFSEFPNAHRAAANRPPIVRLWAVVLEQIRPPPRSVVRSMRLGRHAQCSFPRRGISPVATSPSPPRSALHPSSRVGARHLHLRSRDCPRPRTTACAPPLVQPPAPPAAWTARPAAAS